MKKTFLTGSSSRSPPWRARHPRRRPVPPRVGVIDMARVSAESALGKARRAAREAPERHQHRRDQKQTELGKIGRGHQDAPGRAREQGRC